MVALIQPKEETKVSEVGANEHHIFEVEHNGGTYLVIQKGQGIGITGTPLRRGMYVDVPGPPTNKTSETRSELPFNEKENSPLEDGK